MLLGGKYVKDNALWEEKRGAVSPFVPISSTTQVTKALGVHFFYSWLKLEKKPAT